MFAIICKTREKIKGIPQKTGKISDPDDLASLPNEVIYSGGYVVETMETALWALMNTDNYRDCVLTCVNMGYDADSTAAVAGGLAGLSYGYDSIPAEWVDALVNQELIEACIKGLAESVNGL